MIKPTLFSKDHPLYTIPFEVDEDANAIIFEDGKNEYIVFGVQVPKPEHKKAMANAVKLLEETFGFNATDRAYKLKKGASFIPVNIQFNLDSMDVLLMDGDSFEYAMRIK